MLSHSIVAPHLSFVSTVATQRHRPSSVDIIRIKSLNVVNHPSHCSLPSFTPSLSFAGVRTWVGDVIDLPNYMGWGADAFFFNGEQVGGMRQQTVATAELLLYSEERLL